MRTLAGRQDLLPPYSRDEATYILLLLLSRKPWMKAPIPNFAVLQPDQVAEFYQSPSVCSIFRREMRLL